jgi:hypothetical protein
MPSRGRPAICGQHSDILTDSQINQLRAQLMWHRDAQKASFGRIILRYLESSIIIPSIHLLHHLIRDHAVYRTVRAFSLLKSQTVHCSMPYPSPLHLTLSGVFSSSADYDPSSSATSQTLNSDSAWLCLPVQDASCSRRQPCAYAGDPPRHTFPDPL